MRVGRRKPIWTLFVPAQISFAVATMLGVLLTAAVPADAARASNRRDSVKLQSCETDTECDDGNRCTDDLCIDQVCSHERIADCIGRDGSVCPPVDLVFVMDTSGSMKDEAAALCGDIDQLVADLAALDITVNPTILGITETPGLGFYCLENDVVSLLGDAVPGDPDSCAFPDGPGAYESWGPATAILAAFFPWNEAALRVIVPISDEGPCNGSIPGCYDPGDDRDSITNAITVAIDPGHHVVVSPITGTGSDDCVITLADDLAEGTGGVAFQSEDPDADLAGAIAEIVFAACTTAPVLSLSAGPGNLPEEHCHEVGEEIVVNVELGQSLLYITGGQFLIGYDPSVLDFVSIEVGSNVDPGSPFSEELAQEVDEVNGRVFYAVAVPMGHPGTQGPAVMASLRFVAVTPCATDDLCFLYDNPQTTLLTDNNGVPVPFKPVCTGELLITGGPPTVNCPESVDVNADAGDVTTVVTWDPLTVTDPCDSNLELSCTATHSGGVDIDHLIEAGGLFPPGFAEFECTVMDACGTLLVCSWSVNVNLANTVTVDLELSPFMFDGPLYRCIEFEFFASCSQPSVIIEQLINFGPPDNFPGHAKHLTLKLPPDGYMCATARDPKHTLRSTAYVQTSGTLFEAIFLGDPIFGGNWLTGGNLNGDNVINIVDFGIVVSQYLTVLDPATDCGAIGFHADINGDGLVDQIDVAFVIRNYLEYDKDACCPGRGERSLPMPTTEISVADLQATGLGHLRAADLNGDGLLNGDDIAAFLKGRTPDPCSHMPDRK